MVYIFSLDTKKQGPTTPVPVRNTHEIQTQRKDIHTISKELEQLILKAVKTEQLRKKPHCTSTTLQHSKDSTSGFTFSLKVWQDSPVRTSRPEIVFTVSFLTTNLICQIQNSSFRLPASFCISMAIHLSRIFPVSSTLYQIHWHINYLKYPLIFFCMPILRIYSNVLSFLTLIIFISIFNLFWQIYFIDLIMSTTSFCFHSFFSNVFHFTDFCFYCFFSSAYSGFNLLFFLQFFQSPKVEA